MLLIFSTLFGNICKKYNHSLKSDNQTTRIFQQYIISNTVKRMMPRKNKQVAAGKNDSGAKKTTKEEGSGNKTKQETNSENPKSSKRELPEEENTAPDAKKQKTGFLNKVDTDLDSLVMICSRQSSKGGSSNLKIISWNVAGIRSWIKKDGQAYIKKEQADIVCLQEVKCSESKLPPEAKFKGYHTYWCAGLKEGYAGVALYSKEKPLNVKYGLGKQEYDSEGRLITAEYENYYVVATYVPNAGAGLKNLDKRMRWDKDFRKYLKKLDEEKPVILCGDMNVSHQPIDLANPKTNTKHAGFTQEERDGMTDLLSEGFVDTFRYLYPDKTGAYTYWTYLGNARSRNTGWRLDYFILSEKLLDALCDNVIRNKVYGSDHCPILLYLSL